MKKINFYISRNDTVHEIQESFSRFYPNLEINFFGSVGKTQPVNSCVKFSPEVRIRDISPESQEGCIELNDTMTDTELENLIHDHFNLHVEISPAAGKVQNTNFSTKRWYGKQELSEENRGHERSHSAYFKNAPHGHYL